MNPTNRNYKAVSTVNPLDPTTNVRELINEAIERVDDLRRVEVKRIDDLREVDNIRFDAQQLALKDALISQEKAVAAALEVTKESINKADINTDKRFSLLSEKIDGITNTMNKSSGERGIYVTHSDLSQEMEKLRTSFETMLRPVVTFMNSQTGKGAGANQLWIIIVGVIGVVATVLSISSRFTN